MNKIVTILLSFIILLSGLNIKNAFALIREEVVPFGIVNETYKETIEHKRVYGESNLGEDTSVSITYIVTVNYRYNIATGKIYGSPQNLHLEIIQETSLDELEVTDFSFTKTITDNGYTITYSDISFQLQGRAYLDSQGDHILFDRCYHHDIVVP